MPDNQSFYVCDISITITSEGAMQFENLADDLFDGLFDMLPNYAMFGATMKIRSFDKPDDWQGD